MEKQSLSDLITAMILIISYVVLWLIVLFDKFVNNIEPGNTTVLLLIVVTMYLYNNKK